MTADLAEFLRARLKAHEEAIRADAAHGIEPSIKAGTTWEFTSPDFRLADIDAKRRTIDEHSHIDPPTGTFSCPACVYGAHVDGPCPTLRLLALPYADHADYQPEWRP